MNQCVYCPACGEIETVEPIISLIMITPGQSDWMCPSCETKFQIKIEFYEVSQENTNESQIG